MKFNIENYLNERKTLIDNKLAQYFPEIPGSKNKLQSAINYSINSGGKRLRPILCLASCELVSGGYEDAIPVACAIEMVHTYSLIHDDLPSMDNDDLRRGLPTNHKVFGEAIAILAGDALLTDSFSLIIEECSKKGIDNKLIVQLIKELSLLAGSKGMVLGQSIDLDLNDQNTVIKENIEKVHLLKTATMIEASVVMGAIVGDAKDDQLEKLKRFSRIIGLAFQITDDILDIRGSEDYGKKIGSDAKNKKPTYATTEGIEKSLQRVEELTKQAINCLNNFDVEVNPLREIAYYLSERAR